METASASPTYVLAPPASRFVCPGCRGPLPDLSRCGGCGLKFGDDGGTPILMTPDLDVEFPWRFSASRSAMSSASLAAVFRDPASGKVRRGAGLPYHVDLAHAELLTGLPPGQRVLEIGCGGGQCRPWFRSLGHDYIGTDISKTRVRRWLQEFGGPDLLCDAHFLPFAQRSFDVVYCAAVTEHLACPQLVAREVMRVLRPGGWYLGNVSFLEPWHDNSYYHMSPLGVAELLIGAGFEVQAIWPGRGYSGFRALHAMGFGRGFRRPMRLVGGFSARMYGLQTAVHRVARAATGRAPKSEIAARARTAGATDWIARRPGAAR